MNVRVLFPFDSEPESVVVVGVGDGLELGDGLVDGSGLGLDVDDCVDNGLGESLGLGAADGLGNGLGPGAGNG